MTPCLRGFSFTPLSVVLLAMLTTATGCTSALTTASLRGLPWDTAEKQGDVSDETSAVAADGDSDESDGADAPVDHDSRRAAAIEEAIARLSKVGSLDERAQATLMATLQNTAPEDWPVVVAEFAAALTKAGAVAAAPHVVAKAELSSVVSAPASVPEATPEPAQATEPTPDPATAPEPPASAAAHHAPPGASLWRLSVPSVAPPLALEGDTLVEWGGAQRWLVCNAPAAQVRAAAAAAGGHATLFRAQDKSPGVFAPLSTPLARIQRDLQTAFDPDRVFHRGRLYPDF